MVLVLLGILSVGVSPVAASGVTNTLEASFEYVVGTYSSYYWITNLTSGDIDVGSVAIYDDGSDIYIWVGVWSKPYLAYGELDKNGDGLIDEEMYEIGKGGVMKGDKNKDGKIDRYDLKSDGIIIIGLGNPYGTGKDEGYRWKVDSNTDGSPSQRRDSEITVPSWDLNLAEGGILDGAIVYIAKIPIPSDGTTFQIQLEVHASPPFLPPFPEFVVPEYPFGTILGLSMCFAALAVFKSKRTHLHL